MAYTDDWESLMNGVFGPGGRFKAAPRHFCTQNRRQRRPA